MESGSKNRERRLPMTIRAFISYSHKNAWALDKMHAYLTNLRREGLVHTWTDRNINAGSEIDKSIEKELREANIFIALVSQEFISSKYCYDIEMETALARHEDGSIRIIPVIVEPCDWRNTSFKNLKVLPRDGKPIVEWANQDNAFLDVIGEIRKVLEEVKIPNAHINDEGAEVKVTRKNYRVKRKFSKIEKDDYRIECFEKIRAYIEGSSKEINGIQGIKSRFREISKEDFECVIQNPHDRSMMGKVTVRTRSNGGSGLGDIYYSFSHDAPPNSSEGGFEIEEDEYDLFLSDYRSFGRGPEDRLDSKSAAEWLWSNLLERAGITNV